MALSTAYKSRLVVSGDQSIAGQNYPDNRSVWHPLGEIVRSGGAGTIWWVDNGPKGTDSIVLEPRTFCYKGVATIAFTGTSLAVRINVAYGWFNNALVTIDGVAPSTLGLTTYKDVLSSNAADYAVEVELERYIDVLVADGLTDGEHVCEISVNADLDVVDIDTSRFFSMAGYRVGTNISQLLHKTGAWITPLSDDVSHNKLNLTFANQSVQNIYNVVVQFPATLVDENGAALTNLVIARLKPGESVKRMVQPSYVGGEHSTDATHPPVQYDLVITAEYADIAGVIASKPQGQLTAYDYGGTLTGGSLHEPVYKAGIANWFFGTNYIQSRELPNETLLFPNCSGDTLTITNNSEGFYSTSGLYKQNPGSPDWVDVTFIIFDEDGNPAYAYPTTGEYIAANLAAWEIYKAAHLTLVATVPVPLGSYFPNVYVATGFGAGAHRIYLCTLESKPTQFISAEWSSPYTAVTETVNLDYTARQPIPLRAENVVVTNDGVTFDPPVIGAEDFGPPKQVCTLTSLDNFIPPSTFPGGTHGFRTVTVTTPVPHGFGRNEVVHIRGAEQPEYNVTLVVTPTEPDSFVYYVPWRPLGDSPFVSFPHSTENPTPTTLTEFTVQKDFQSYPIRKNADLVYTEIMSRFPTFAVCYQSGYREILGQYDVLIIDPIAAASRDVLYWQSLGIEVYGYVASGEEVGFYSERYNFASALAPFAGDGLGPGGYAGYYMYTRYGTTGAGWVGTWNLPDKNGVWASYYTNPDPEFGWPQRVDNYYAPLVHGGPLNVVNEVLTYHDEEGIGRVTDTLHSPIDPDELLEIHWFDGTATHTFQPYTQFTFDAKTGAIVMNRPPGGIGAPPLYHFNTGLLSAVNGGETTITYTRKGHHCEGVFWDVVDTPDVYLSTTFEFGYANVPGYDTLFIEFLNNFKANHPTCRMISNRGFTVLPHIIHNCAGVMFESWLTHPTDIAHLFTTDYAIIDDPAAIAYNEPINAQLRALRKTNIFELYSLNYCLPGEPGQELRDYCASMDAERGYLSWTSTITLDVPAPNTPVSPVGPPGGPAIPGTPYNQFGRVSTVPV